MSHNGVRTTNQHKTARWVVGMVALAISLLYGFYHFLWLYDLGWDYRHAIFISSLAQCRDTYHYLGQIKEVYEGHTDVANPYIVEYKDAGKPAWPVFPIQLAAWLGMALHLKVQYLAILMDLVLPPLIFLIVYWLLTLLSASTSLAILGAFILTATPLLLFVQQMLNFIVERPLRLFGSIPSLLFVSHYGGFSRTIHPQLTYIPFLLALTFFVKWCLAGRKRYAFGSILFGIMTTYAYVFFSTYLYTLLGVIIIAGWLSGERAYSRKAALVLTPILIGSLPFWISLFRFSGHDMQSMVTMEHKHTPVFSLQLGLNLLAGVLWFVLLKARAVNAFTGILVCALLFSGILCVNQHVLTGVFVQSWHYEVYVVPQALIFAVLLLFAKHEERRRPWLAPPRIIFFGGGLIMLFFSILIHPALIKLAVNQQLWGLVSRLPLLDWYWGGISVAVLLILAGAACEKWRIRFAARPIEIVICALIITYILWDVGLGRYVWYQNVLKPNFGALQQLAPALQWLDTHTAKDSVVVGMPGRGAAHPRAEYVSTDVLVSIYTQNNAYVSDYAQYHAIPITELQDRLYNLFYLMGITNKVDFNALLRGMWLKGRFADYQQKFGQTVYAALTGYQADYLFYGPRERQAFQVDPESYPFFQKVYDDQIAAIYRVVIEPGRDF